MPRLAVIGCVLRVEPFVISRWGQMYVSLHGFRIDFTRLPAETYRIVAVHDFRVEDRNPRLDECIAGVFLARQMGLRWEQAEDHPLECRTIAVLGHLDTAARRLTTP